MTVVVQRLEGATIAILAAAAFVLAGFEWWWLAVLFLVFDVSVVGYLAGPRVGAMSYNAVHSLAGPCLVATAALLTNADWTIFVAAPWFFHVGIDRAAGYGLKETRGFRHTHLGMVGRRASSDPTTQAVRGQQV